ncbi:IPTL-CTERM sorting domain-containing protein [Acidovorax sp. 62]|uniref:IPTL-CTERM sorting domain-containing protein n=1 Tax=Acidovorax sp. 62 TaxID=2035203 RepID=UPI0013041EE6|nr:IPTL-CTERM sorting domain-containing protein [Acidovorax sp. 62]
MNFSFRPWGWIPSTAVLTGALASGVCHAAAPTYEDFDTYTYPVPGSTEYVSNAFLFNDWEFSVLRPDGQLDPYAMLAVTDNNSSTMLANNGDPALLMDGASNNSGTALVLKSATGEKFKFNGLTVEDFISSSLLYRIVGLRNGSPVSGAVQLFTAPSNGATSNGLNVPVSGSAWNYVDEIRIVLQNGGIGVSLFIDDINVSAGISPVTTSISSAQLSADSGTSSTDFITNVAAQTLSGALSANLAAGETVSVSLNNGGSWTAATATVGQNTWSLSGITLAGSNTLQVKVVDADGASGPVFSQAYVLDNTAPTVTFSGLAFSADTGVSSSDFITNTPAQTITATLSSALAGSDTVYGSLDGGATWTDITSKVSGTSLSWNGVVLAPGSQTLQLKVVDGAGNNGSVRSQAYTLMTSLPNTPSTPVLAVDTGISSTDQLVNLTAPTLQGTADAGATVTLYEGADSRGSVTATGGVWSLAASGLGSGAHTLNARASDVAGNVSAASANVTITIDTTAPAVTAVAVPANGTYHAGDTLYFTVQLDEPVYVSTSGGTPRIALTVGSTTRYADYVSGSGTSALLFGHAVVTGDSDSDGITVGALGTNGGTMIDAAGNAASTTLNSVGSTASVLVDALVPTVAGVSASTANGSYGVGQTILITLTFSTAVNVNTAGGTPTLALNSGGVATYTSGSGTNTLTFTYTVGASQNSADLDYTSTSALALNGATVTETGGAHQAASLTLATPGTAGSLGANKNIVIDTTAPTTSVASASFSADTGSSSTDFITKTAAQTISGTLSANLAAGESVWVSLDNGASWVGATATVGSNTWSLSGATLMGSNTLKVRLQDAADNAGAVLSQAYVLDTTPPATPAVNSQSVHSVTPTLTGTATLSAGEVLTVGVGGATYQVVPVAGNWSLNLALASPLSGTLALSYSTTYSVTATATDLAGNAAVDVTSNELAIGTAPALPDAPAFTSVTAADRSVTLVWSVPAANNSAISTYEVTGSPSGSCSVNSGTTTTCTIGGLTNGTSYTFRVRATNGVGNSVLSAPSAAVVPRLLEVTSPAPGMTGTAKATLSGGGSACTLAPSSGFAGLSHPAPAGKTMPYGEYAYRATDCATSVTMTLEYPEPLPTGIQFWKYGPATVGATAFEWFQLSGVSVSPDRRTVTYTILDNGVGDSDAAVGSIVDPIAPMLGPVDPAGIPVDNPWALALLSTMLGMFAWRRQRHAACI